MATTDKEYRLKITGDARELGRSTKEAAASMNSLKQEALGLGAALTGGIIGGGVAGVISSVIGKVTDMLREARQLARDAERLDISRGAARGMRNLESLLALEPGTFGSATSSVRQQVQEAAAGSPEAIKAIESFGLRLESLSRLSPDQQLSAVLRAAGGMNRMNDAQRAQFRTLVGSGGADLEAYVSRVDMSNLEAFSSAQTEALSNIAELVRGVSAVPTGYRLLSRMMGPVGDVPFQAAEALDARERARRDGLKEQYEPLAQYGVGSENRAAKLDEELRQRVLSLSRQQLTIEERIKAVTEERDSVLRRAAAETNVERRRRLELRAVDYEAELLQLGAVPQSQPTASGESATPSDQFTRVGRYLFGAGAGSVDVGRQSLQALKDVKTILEKAPSEIGRSVADNL
jgi:hypothetical protein